MSWFKTTKAYSIINNKCPRCHEGDMFVYKNPYDLRNLDKMPVHCPVCGQKYEIEPMFFVGAMYASYAISIAFAVATFVIVYTFFTLPMYVFVGIVAAVLVLTTPLTFRWSRTMWLNFFVHYDATFAKQA